MVRWATGVVVICEIDAVGLHIDVMDSGQFDFHPQLAETPFTKRVLDHPRASPKNL